MTPLSVFLCYLCSCLLQPLSHFITIFGLHLSRVSAVLICPTSLLPRPLSFFGNRSTVQLENCPSFTHVGLAWLPCGSRTIWLWLWAHDPNQANSIFPWDHIHRKWKDVSFFKPTSWDDVIQKLSVASFHTVTSNHYHIEEANWNGRVGEETQAGITLFDWYHLMPPSFL